ncbi:hypothetical protein HB904_17015 [Listeria booriae]|uniref:Uncharacterized protein n=1 Tax=Listeria booriae TaxID=1552123 RepID=A0A841YP50_9LIST|nr:hypothetical protein [Listeria booriae]MBC1402149.1 hypothetical protein [Listeria booriae]MBC1617881.1 hypothetical protein [Listeria booriae]
MTKVVQMAEKNSSGVVETFYPMAHAEGIVALRETVAKIFEETTLSVSASEKAAWNAKETTAGAQAKADAALAAAKAFTDAYFKEKNIWDGATYFLSSHTFTWNLEDLKQGVFVEMQRYLVGTGALGYGYHVFFIPKKFILKNPNKAYYLMTTDTAGAKKTIRLTSTTITGDDSNSDSPHNAYCVSNVFVI